MVDQDRLQVANGRLYAAEEAANRFAGPPLGSFLFAAAAAVPFLFDAASFGVAALLILLMTSVHRLARVVGEGPSVPLITLGGAAANLALGLVSSPVVAAIAMVGLGLGAMWGAVIAVSLRQTIVPERLLGRVNSAYRLLAWGSQPLGAAWEALSVASSACGHPTCSLGPSCSPPRSR